jgi:transcription initiation factor IIF auxiliary subunit
MKKNVFPVVILIMVISLVVCVNAQDKGSETVIFEKGRMSAVTFDHHMHQDKLDNECNACHDLFPMKKGIIKEMITEEKLKKQQVMNSKCVKCHKDITKQGLKAGPTKCTECHVRSN